MLTYETETYDENCCDINIAKEYIHCNISISNFLIHKVYNNPINSQEPYLFKDKSKISDYEYRSPRCLMHIRKKYVISEM